MAAPQSTDGSSKCSVPWKASGSRRCSRSETELRIQKPANKGRVVTSVNWHDAVTTTVQIEAEEFARLRPLLDEFTAAIQAAQAS